MSFASVSGYLRPSFYMILISLQREFENSFQPQVNIYPCSHVNPALDKEFISLHLLKLGTGDVLLGNLD